MKKIYTLLLATLGVSVAAMAQRDVNLEVTLVTPSASSTIQSGSTVNVSAIIKNIGTDTLKSSDTLLYGYLLNGNIMPFTDPNNPSAPPVTVFGVTGGDPIAPGDSATFEPAPFTITFGTAANGMHDFCIQIEPRNQGVDSLRDTAIANNRGCHNLTFAGGTDPDPGSVITLSLTDGAKSSVINVFPNPAVSSATFMLNLVQNQNVTVKVVDLAGRVVLREDKGTLLKGENNVSVNTAGLTPGLYLYQITMGNHTATGKLNIAK